MRSRVGGNQQYHSCAWPSVRRLPRARLFRCRAWATTPEGEPLGNNVQYSWEVEAGSAQSHGDRAQWDLGNIAVGAGESKVVAAKVIVANAQWREHVVHARRRRLAARRSTSNAARGAEPRGCSRPARRSWPAMSVKRAAMGSTVICCSARSPMRKSVRVTRKRLKRICAFCRASISCAQYVAPSEFNITYIPVLEKPASAKTDTEWAERVLEVYDYARGKSRVESAR